MDEGKVKDVVGALVERQRHITLQAEEYLSSINENTTEIQSLFDYLNEVDGKIEKLSQRIDRMELSKTDKAKPIYPLTHSEKQLFISLYTEKMPLTLLELAEKSKIPVSVINEHITQMAQKGIPIMRTVANNQLFVKINDGFKEMQAKNGCVNFSLTSFM